MLAGNFSRFGNRVNRPRGFGNISNRVRVAIGRLPARDCPVGVDGRSMGTAASTVGATLSISRENRGANVVRLSVANAGRRRIATVLGRVIVG